MLKPLGDIASLFEYNVPWEVKKEKGITTTDEMESDLSVCSQGYDVKIINTYVLSYIVWASLENHFADFETRV